MRSRTWNGVVIGAALLAGGLSLASQAADRGPAELFPTPAEGMTIPGRADEGPHVGEEELTLEELLVQFGQLTGVHILRDPDFGGFLQTTRTDLDRDLVVEPEQLYTVVESILIQHRFALVDYGGSEPRMMGVFDLDGPRRHVVKPGATYITEDQLPVYENHPALMVTVALKLENLDIRTLHKPLRGLITDPNTMQAIPIPEAKQVILTGFGPTVAGLARMLRLMNEVSKPPGDSR